MEWLLIIALHYPPKEVKIEDNRFPTYEECMLAVDEVLNGERSLVFCKPYEEKDETAESTINASPIKPVVRFEYSCRKVTKKEPNRC